MGEHMRIQDCCSDVLFGRLHSGGSLASAVGIRSPQVHSISVRLAWHMHPLS